MRRLIAGIVLAAAAGGFAADWPMFRGGPDLIGVSPETLPDKPGLLWTFKTGGAVKSSAAVAGGKVYFGSSDNCIYALNLADGVKAWSFKTEGEVESSPLVLEGKVFAGSSDNFLYALDAATGKQVWKYETGDKILGAPNWFKAAGKTWVLAGSYDYKLHCVDAATGKSNWVYETGNYINGSPAVAGGRSVFGGCDGMLHVVRLADGTEEKQVEAFVIRGSLMAGGDLHCTRG